MARMRAAEAAVLILEREGACDAFWLPGAAINPFYAAMRAHGGIRRGDLGEGDEHLDGPGLNAVNEFEPLALSGVDAPTAISVMA